MTPCRPGRTSGFARPGSSGRRVGWLIPVRHQSVHLCHRAREDASNSPRRCGQRRWAAACWWVHAGAVGNGGEGAAMPDGRSEPAYALPRSTEEYERLSRQAAFLRGTTDRLFQAAGVGPGMRILDVGSGAGDVAFLAAELVGPTGHVVGVDLDRAAVETAR